MFDFSKLRGRIIEKFGTIRAFAEAVDTSLVSVSHKLNGRTDISRADIIKWSEILDISPAEYGAYFFTPKV